MTRSFTFTDDGKAIARLIEGVKRAANSARDRIALCCACCVGHIVVHGNVTVISNLIEAVGPGFRNNSIKKWFLAMAPVVWEKRGDDEKAQFYLDQSRIKAAKAELKKDSKAFYSALMAEPPWVFDPEPEFKPVNVVGLLKALCKRVETAQSEHGDDKRNDFTGFDKVQTLVEELTNS